MQICIRFLGLLCTTRHIMYTFRILCAYISSVGFAKFLLDFGLRLWILYAFCIKSFRKSKKICYNQS